MQSIVHLYLHPRLQYLISLPMTHFLIHHLFLWSFLLVMSPLSDSLSSDFFHHQTRHPIKTCPSLPSMQVDQISMKEANSQFTLTNPLFPEEFFDKASRSWKSIPLQRIWLSCPFPSNFKSCLLHCGIPVTDIAIFAFSLRSFLVYGIGFQILGVELNQNAQDGC